MKKIVLATAMSMMFVANALAGGDIQAGKVAAEKFGCAACHGADFNTPIDPSYPKLAGQHQDYLVHSLIAYQRPADVPNRRVNAIMGAQVQALSSKDIQDIAAYIHSLPGTLVVRK
jgi:cytochrome c553